MGIYVYKINFAYCITQEDCVYCAIGTVSLYMCLVYVNHLRIKRSSFYLKAQSGLRSKHLPPRL